MQKSINNTKSRNQSLSRGTSSQIGLVSTEDLLWRKIFNCTLRTCESSLGIIATITAKGHRFLGASMSFRRTTSPSFRSGRTVCHLRRGWRDCMYSFFHLFQNMSAKTWTLFHSERIMSLEVKFSKSGGAWLLLNFCVRSVLGERTAGFSGSLDTGSSGR